jgi:hypothetical protein
MFLVFFSWWESWNFFCYFDRMQYYNGSCDLVFQVWIVMCLWCGLFAIHFYIILILICINHSFLKIGANWFHFELLSLWSCSNLILEFSSFSCELGNTLWIFILLQIHNRYVVYIDHTKRFTMQWIGKFTLRLLVFYNPIA